MAWETLAPADGGWVFCVLDRSKGKPLSDPSRITTFWLRLGEGSDRRLEVRELYLGDGSRLDTDLLRSVPLGRIEAGCNSLEPLQRDIRARLGTPVPNVWKMFEDEMGNDFAAGVMMESGVPDRSWDSRARSVKPRRPSLKLPVPKNSKSRYPDSFYEHFAAVYAFLVREGFPGPAKAVAQANAVPVTTVHRWAKEARRRGLLAPGRQGKAL
jgi:hypothetical protein